jgi:hypothetical protein
VSKRMVVSLTSALSFGAVDTVALAQGPLLQPGTPVARAMESNEPHEYRVSVQAGQAVRVRVTQFDLDVAVVVVDPKGQPIVEVDSPTGAAGDEDVSVVAVTAGDYVIRVKPSKSPGGRYELRVEPPRTPTPEDRQRAELLQLLDSGGRLLNSDDAAQRADTVRRIQRAIATARKAGDTIASHALFGRLLGTDPRAALDSLDVPTMPGTVKVYHSRGYEARARSLQTQVTRAVDYYAKRLQIRPTIVMAVLAQEESQALSGNVYGFPWTDGGRWSSVVVMPATHPIFDEITVGIRQRPKASAAIAQAERATGLSLEDGIRLTADTIMYHELGHIFASAYGIGTPNLWFDEFVAHYFSEAYNADAAPDPRVPPFDKLINEPDGSGPPKHTALEDLERLYSDVGPANYGWYQQHFARRAKAVYKTEGFAFLTRLKTALPSSESDRLPVSEVLSRLERLSPGFVAWAESLAALSRKPADRP